MKKIAAWGDSITWGANDDERGGWVRRIGDGRAINLGIRGEKVGDVLGRFQREAAAVKPDVVIIAIGINDTPHLTHPEGTPLPTFRETFGALLGRAVLVGDTIALGPTNVDDDLAWYHGYRNETIKPYAGAIEQLAEQHGARFVDLDGVIHNNHLVDGLHPDGAGHKNIAQRVEAALGS